MTYVEYLVWSKLRREQLGVKFWRQHNIDDRYIVDFYCSNPKLVIEIDGGQHCDNEQDQVRDEYLRSKGCKILRFWNHDVLHNLDGCLSVIAKEIGCDV